MEEVLKYLASFGLGGLVVGYSAIHAFKHPELVEKWRATIYDWLSLINSKYKYHATKNDIQGKINSFVSNLAGDLDIDPPRVKLRWTAQDDEEEVHLEDDEVIIVMRDRGYKNKNFVHAAYFYTSTTLLSHTKRHLSKKQGESLDLFTAKKVIERSNKSALELFMRDYFQPLLEDDKIRALINQFVEIDKSGLYTHVLLQELSYLGSKTFLNKKDQAVIGEVHNLIDFLLARANREVGDNSGDEEFIGKYSRCSIKIVSTKAVRDAGKYEKPAERVLRAFNSGVENVYILGPLKDGGKKFIEDVCACIVERNPKIEVIKKDKFTNVTRKNKVEKQTDTYFAHLQNPAHTQYLIEDSMIERVEEFAKEATDEKEDKTTSK